MTPVETLVVLRNAPYFEMASVQALVVLVQGAEIRRLVAGETLFDVGQQGDRFYLVAAGVVSLVGPILQARFGRGQILGGAPAFTDRMHAYRAVAETESILIGVRHTDLDDACEDHFDLARSIWRGTALDRDRLMTLRARRQAEAARADAAE